MDKSALTESNVRAFGIKKDKNMPAKIPAQFFFRLSIQVPSAVSEGFYFQQDQAGLEVLAVLPCSKSRPLATVRSSALCISEFMPIPTPLRYCEILSSDITPTTDPIEKANDLISPASQSSNEIRGERRDPITKDRRDNLFERLEKGCCV
ncbi:hypothetical protein TNCV_2309511 [Trichonephila clavipes]|nr:hypothetical protein TNCV_2309511 [Trichonephila clavipes]